MALKEIVASLFGWFGNRAATDAAAAGEVLTRHAERLMRMRGVMSVGVGRAEDGRSAIVLGLDDPLNVSDDLPKEVEGVPVIHREVGRPEAR